MNMWGVDTDRVHAALHHSGVGDQAGYTAGHKALKDVDVRLVRLLVSHVWIRLTAYVVAYLHAQGNQASRRSY